MDINKEVELKQRELFERFRFGDQYDELKAYYDEYESENHDRYPPYTYENEWVAWLTAKAQAVPEGFILIDQKNVENWYLDENESIWWEHDGIDNTLCDLPIGRVEEVHHKEFLIIKNNSLFAAIAWDEENNQPGTWEFFETKEKANEVAAYCKSMNEAQEQSHD